MTVAYDQRGVMTGDDGGGDHNSSFRIYLPSSVLSAASGNQCQVVFFWGVGTGASAGILLSYIGKSGGTNNYDFTGDQAQVTWNGGNATQASVLGAHIATSTITGYPAAPVLTVGTITSGTIAAGQALVDVGGGFFGYVGTNVSGGSTPGSVWNIVNATGNEAASGFFLPGVSTSDVITLGENFDATANYVFAFDITNADNNTHLAFGTVTNVNTYYVATSGSTNNAAATNPSGFSDSGTANDSFGIAAIMITSGAQPSMVFNQLISINVSATVAIT